MTMLLVPYHHDERLTDDDIPVRADVIVQPPLPDGDIWRRLAAVNDATAAAVSPVVSAGRVPLVFTGDCLLTAGTVAGVQRAGVDPAVVWFDAHGDVHTLETTTSGYLGGLSLRLLTGTHPDIYAELIDLRPVPADRTLLIDARDLDPAEASYLATGAIRRLPVDELTEATAPAGPLVLHIDLDVIDARELPGLRFPASNGPSTESVLAACSRLLNTGRVVAVDVACPWHRSADEAERTVRGRLLSQLRNLVTPEVP